MIIQPIFLKERSILCHKQLLAHFLRFSAGMYKQSFSDAALIYHQNPYITKVATLEMWNKLGRLVNCGEHSIAVFGEDNRAKHLFEYRQTKVKCIIPNLCKLTNVLVRNTASNIICGSSAANVPLTAKLINFIVYGFMRIFQKLVFVFEDSVAILLFYRHNQGCVLEFQKNLL